MRGMGIAPGWSTLVAQDEFRPSGRLTELHFSVGRCSYIAIPGCFACIVCRYATSHSPHLAFKRLPDPLHTHGQGWFGASAQASGVEDDAGLAARINRATVALETRVRARAAIHREQSSAGTVALGVRGLSVFCRTFAVAYRRMVRLKPGALRCAWRRFALYFFGTAEAVPSSLTRAVLLLLPSVCKSSHVTPG